MIETQTSFENGHIGQAEVVAYSGPLYSEPIMVAIPLAPFWAELCMIVFCGLILNRLASRLKKTTS